MPGLIDWWNESSPRQLRIFVSLARSLKFSRTADHFWVAQPTLSNIVREIEEEVGIRLFERTTRSVKLTAALQKSVTDPEVRSRLDGMGVAAGHCASTDLEARIGAGQIGLGPAAHWVLRAAPGHGICPALHAGRIIRNSCCGPISK